jgi:hypothetical protein
VKTNRTWPGVLADSSVIFLLAVALIRPLFKIKYTALWFSIESTFIADGRFLKDHWPHPLWQPLWYCGTRFDYIYPPALRYGTAALSKAFSILPVRAYHLYIAIFYCLGIAGVYLFVRLVARGRGAAWLAAIMTLLLSPSFLFLKDLRLDAWHLVPVRLGVLVRYGEGPHISALSLLPFALLSGFMAIQSWRPALFALAALFSSLVVSNNFYGAIALAIFFPVLVWGVWATHLDHWVWLRAAGIAALAYGLTAFWLVPSYFQVTTRNMRYVSLPGNVWSRWVALAVALTFGLLSLRFARGRRDLAYRLFVCGSALAFGLVVLGERFLNFRLIGDAHRLAPEFDLAVTLFLVECVRYLWTSDFAGLHLPFSRAVLTMWIRVTLVVMVAAWFIPSIDYLRHAREIFVSDPNYRQRIEYRLTDWIGRNLPGARCFAIGSVRYWYDTWGDLAQMDGGSQQGLINDLIPQADFLITNGQDAAAAVAWMQAMGVDAVIVTSKKSQEVYHDFVDPRKFDGILPEIFNDQQGDIIYKIPRRYPGLARAVETSRFSSIAPIRSVLELDRLRAYVDAVEHGPDFSGSLKWDGTDAMVLRANLKPAQSILVQETYDTNWRAYSDGRALPVHRDPVGFMWIEVPPGERDVRLQFETPLENRVGRMLFLASALIVIWLVLLGSNLLSGFRRRA